MRPEEIRGIFQNAADFEEHTVEACGKRLTAFFIDGLTSGGDIAELVLRPLRENLRADGRQTLLEQAETGAVWCASVSRAKDAAAAAEKLVNGFCVVLFPGETEALCFETKTGEKRGPSAPESESTVKGAKDAFTETMRTNTSLVRRHLRTPSLRLEQKLLGSRSGTGMTICYLDGVCRQEHIERMRRRLDTIRLEGVLSPAAVEETVSGSRATAFPLLQYTERTDKFCQGLLSGQIGLLVDGLPMGYLLPTTFHLLMHAPEDESHHYLLASALIVLRYFALAISLMFPALYVAVAMYHQEMIPAKLLLSVIQAKQQVPFSVPAIILFMLIAFELLQEAGLRLPNSIGQTVSIIGALLVGQSAVDAKVVSPVAIIVVALAGIAGYTLPNQELSNAVRLLRLGLVLAAALAGLFGILAMLGLVIWYLCTIDSDGVAYMAPFVDSERPTIFRTLLRRPQPDEKFRPPEYGCPNRRRQR